MLMWSHIINVAYFIALRFKEDKCSCALLESNELSSFEKNLRGGGGRRTLRGGPDGVLAPCDPFS
jgi:hypothetical protein